MDVILDTSAVRFRELYGFTWPDRDHVIRADAGRGMQIYVFGTPPAHRLPLRAYHAGMFFKNHVPVGYVETLTFFERMEVGFNLYYTFRAGETAWLYARLLRLMRQLLGVTCFSVDPYQIGHENDEAIDSGAFWFYRKLGFRPASQEVARLMEAEERKMREQPGYRTPPAILRRLAVAPMIFNGGPEWDRFSVRKVAQASAREGVAGWPAVFERLRFSPIPEIIRAKTAPTETRYVRLLMRNTRLRSAVLRLGSV
jgi:hypothetical protein